MILEQLNDLIRRESGRLELKATTGSLRQGFESICGFLNTNGGVLLFGVTDDKRIVGQDISGLAAPEFEEHMAEVIVRMFPTPFAPSTIAELRLDESQLAIINSLARIDGSGSLSAISKAIGSGVTLRQIRYGLQKLRSENLVEVLGQGRGAEWHFVRTRKRS